MSSKQNGVASKKNGAASKQNDTSNGNIFSKIAQLFKTANRPPPPRFGDGKYDSEEDGATLKVGIIKALTDRKKTIPEDLDLILEFINLAKAGGYVPPIDKFNPFKMVCVVVYVNCRLRGWSTSLPIFLREGLRKLNLSLLLR